MVRIAIILNVVSFAIWCIILFKLGFSEKMWYLEALFVTLPVINVVTFIHEKSKYHHKCLH
jgi:hypothetical protein